MKIAVLALLSIMIVLPASPLISSPPQRDFPAEIESGRRALQSAKTDLERAGGEWGGHRVVAIKKIDEALIELNEGEKWARAHRDIK